MAFWDQYKTYKWQGRRAGAIARYEGKCGRCGRSDTDLEVHHNWYIKELKVWEYPPQALVPLCPRCHSDATEVQIELRKCLVYLNPQQQSQVLSFIHNELGCTPMICPRIEL